MVGVHARKLEDELHQLQEIIRRAGTEDRVAWRR